MDTARFDTMTRSLAIPGSRRRALGGVLAAALGVLRQQDDVAEAHNPRAACKKKSGKARQTCLKKAKKHTAAHADAGRACTRSCAGKVCGSDGCGGSCGACIGGSCPNGQCICPAASYDCLGRCCANGEACFADSCGACEEPATLCTETGDVRGRVCGRTSSGDICACVTSIGGTTTCANFDQAQCLGCDGDADCQDMIVAGATVDGVCVDFANCIDDDPACERLCMPPCA